MKKILVLLTACALLLLMLAACVNETEENSAASGEGSVAEQTQAESKPWYDTSVPDNYVSDGVQNENSTPENESSMSGDAIGNKNELGEGIVAIPDMGASGYRIVFTKENPINAVECNTNVQIAVTAIYDGSVTRFFGAVNGQFYFAKPGKYLYPCCEGFCAGDRATPNGDDWLEFEFDKDSGAFINYTQAPHGHGKTNSYTVYQPSVKKVYGYQDGEAEMLYLYPNEGTVICRLLSSSYDLEANWKNGTMEFPSDAVGKYGLTYYGEVVIPFEYDYMATYRSMSDGTYGNAYAVVLAVKDGRCYYFSNNGTNLTPEGFDCGSQPFGDRAWVFEDGQGWIVEFN